METCVLCGHKTDDHDRHVRFILPEPLLGNTEKMQANDSWLSHDDPASSVMMQVPGFGAFVRALLPITLIGGYTITYGVWVGIHPDDLQQAFAVWQEPEYAALRLSGLLANNIAPWGLSATPVELAVRDPTHTPYCVSSPDATLNDVLTREWNHETVIGALPSA
ncbi:DUF2199 domain-containing protein [Pseudonocardia sp.]|jgi:hypothetical protein|uniref:DUF2199 domain-containing protein n=1 Tax=Pseudonocardia sp. TaxID=60912 RepID=UPI0031FC2A96